MYFVIDLSGAQYGPADLPTLQQWAQEGRLSPTTTIRDASTGQTIVANAIPGLFPAAPPNPYATPASYAQYSPYGGMYPDAQSQKDVTTAWVLAIIGLLCCAPFAIGGVVIANRALAAGNESARAPQIVSWIAIGIWAIMLVLRIVAIGSGFGF